MEKNRMHVSLARNRSVDPNAAPGARPVEMPRDAVEQPDYDGRGLATVDGIVATSRRAWALALEGERSDSGRGT